MNKEKLQEIKEALSGITQSDWEFAYLRNADNKDNYGVIGEFIHDDLTIEEFIICEEPYENCNNDYIPGHENIDFIANAPQWMRELVVALEEFMI